jgi:RHS repeat-associated protein
VVQTTLDTSTYTTSLLGVTAEQTPNGTIGYTRLPTGEVLSRRTTTTRHYLLPDHLGSTQALVDHTGTITTRYDYTPYGRTTTTPLTTGHIDQPYRYTGQHQDPTGLYKMGLRYYHPDQARWTQPDPALPNDQLPFGNTYLYVGGNPINYIDPTGAIDVPSGVGCLAGVLGTGSTFAGLAAGGPLGFAGSQILALQITATATACAQTFA